MKVKQQLVSSRISGGHAINQNTAAIDANTIGFMGGYRLPVLREREMLAEAKMADVDDAFVLPAQKYQLSSVYVA